jgi:hypothetical protein
MEQETQLSQDIAELLAVLKNTQETTRLQDDLFAKLDLIVSQNTQILAKLSALSQVSQLPPLISPQDLFSSPSQSNQQSSQQIPVSQQSVSGSFSKSSQLMTASPSVAPSSKPQSTLQSNSSITASSTNLPSLVSSSAPLTSSSSAQQTRAQITQPLLSNPIDNVALPDASLDFAQPLSFDQFLSQSSPQPPSQQIQSTDALKQPTSVTVQASQTISANDAQLQPPIPPSPNAQVAPVKKTTRSTFGSWFS